MKKLLLVLALLILTGQGAFAATITTYPNCYQGYGATDPLYNGTNGDDQTNKGWCVDGFGVRTPRPTIVSSINPNSQGGFAVPVVFNTTYYSAATTFDVLIPQQTGSNIVDTGAYSLVAGRYNALASMATIDTLSGTGSHYVLPMAMPGEIVTISSASKSVVTVDTMTPALATAFGLTSNIGAAFTTSDTIEWSPGGTAMTAGQNLKSPGFAGDTITLYCPFQGMWMIGSMQGSTSNTATSDTLWTVISTQ